MSAARPYAERDGHDWYVVAADHSARLGTDFANRTQAEALIRWCETGELPRGWRLEPSGAGELAWDIVTKGGRATLWARTVRRLYPARAAEIPVRQRTDEVAYAVTGRWPFPKDMLRRDGSRPATDADAALIVALDEDAEPGPSEIHLQRTINLVGPSQPLVPGWASFSWRVEGAPEQAAANPDPRIGAARAALAKLTAEERAAIEWCAGRKLP